MVETFILFSGSFMAGILGALTGLGGGVILVPLLTIGVGVPMPYAVGASLVSVIGTSSGAASGFVRKGFTNIRVGIFLEIATTVGAIFGALLSGVFSSNVIGVIFGVLLWITLGLNMFSKPDERHILKPNSLSDRLGLHGSFSDGGKTVFYSGVNALGGFIVMIIAGIFSGLLGIGAGALKVLAMDNIMRLPFRVSTTTSNFMMGVTAASGAFVYFQRGQIIAPIVAPVLIGVVLGSFLGSYIFAKMRIQWLRLFFFGVVFIMSSYMIYKGLNGEIA